MAKAPAWAQVKLRVSWGEIPDAGDELVITSTGRRYQVLGVRGRSLQCLVLPPDAPTDAEGRVWQWQWARRRNVPRTG